MELTEGVVEVVVAADDMGHAHVVVVDDDRQHVGRRAVGTQQHEIVELLVGDADIALNMIADYYLAFGRHPDADDGRDNGRRLRSEEHTSALQPRMRKWYAG